MRFGYPVVLDVHDVSVLVVGAGPVAVRKVVSLVDAGASVRVVAIDVDPALDAVAVAEVRQRAYEPGDLDGVRLVVTATGIVDVDASVAADATSRGIWVNAADQTSDCSFILPAIARDGSVSVAVSTDGTAPAVASWLRDRIAHEVLDDDARRIASAVAERRREIRARGESTEGLDWRGEIERLRHP